MLRKYRKDDPCGHYLFAISEGVRHRRFEDVKRLQLSGVKFTAEERSTGTASYIP